MLSEGMRVDGANDEALAEVLDEMDGLQETHEHEGESPAAIKLSATRLPSVARSPWRTFVSAISRTTDWDSNAWLSGRALARSW